MKILGGLNNLKEKILASNQMKGKKDCPEEVKKAIASIKEKI